MRERFTVWMHGKTDAQVVVRYSDLKRETRYEKHSRRAWMMAASRCMREMLDVRQAMQEGDLI